MHYYTYMYIHVFMSVVHLHVPTCACIHTKLMLYIVMFPVLSEASPPPLPPSLPPDMFSEELASPISSTQAMDKVPVHVHVHTNPLGVLSNYSTLAVMRKEMV